MTAPIFNKKGYAGTSITDLTEATKLTSGSIYGNFSNKEEVAVAALDYNISRFRDGLQGVIGKSKSAKEGLLRCVNVFRVSSNSSYANGGCPMQNALCDGDDILEPLRIKAADGLMFWKQEVEQVIEKGITEGSFKPEVDAGKTALHIIALCEFGFLTYSATRSASQVDQILDMAIDVAKSIMVAP